MHKEPKLGGSRALARQALSGLLAILFLLSATLSANHSLHRLLHQDGAATHFCLACSLVNGQLAMVEAGLVTALFVLGLFVSLALVRSPVLPGSDYRLSPSRAPPSR